MTGRYWRRPHFRFFILLAATLALIVVACDVRFVPPPPGDEPTPPGTTRGWYEIFFTEPDCPPEQEREGGVDEIIAADLLRAQSQVDVAAFDLDAESIVDALIELEEGGVAVRVVTDDQNEDQDGIRRLRRNGTGVVTDDRSALMHDKFIVVDGRVVWTGSLNYTSNGAYCNNNNAVRIESPLLARNYQAEMDEMYIDHDFGPLSPDATPLKQLRIGDVLIENYFASEEDVASLLANVVAEAESEILFMAYSFTQEDIGEAMLARAEQGVTLRGIFETTGSETPFSYFPVMRDAGLSGVSVRQDGNPRLMHHKVIIVDRRVVVFGSFNFSGNANDSNDENVLIVHDPEFTSFFVEEFNLLWEEAGR